MSLRDLKIDDMKSKKIAIVGITGAGKSTLSRRIAEKTGLPVFHMDALFWRGKWQEVPEREYIEAHRKILYENDRWIIEGWVNEGMADRIRDADLVIYLDYPGWLCATHYVERWQKHRHVARPELPEESRERFKLRRFFLILFRVEREQIETLLSKTAHPEKVVRISSMEELEEYLVRFF
jgi:adenylate kinase family enzyme